VICLKPLLGLVSTATFKIAFIIHLHACNHLAGKYKTVMDARDPDTSANEADADDEDEETERKHLSSRNSETQIQKYINEYQPV
jgi:hypothetical protein